MSVTDILVDFAIASFFIAVGQLLRAKVPLVQKFFIPPSMIAGFIALALGAQGLGILPFSENIGSYASVLIILIFAGVGINGFSFNKKDFKAEIDRIGSYFSYKVLAQAIQFSLAPLFSILVISKLFPNINYGFGLLLAAGFSGGHGTAAAVGTAFERLGDLDAMDIAMTCATVGILSGIFGGLFFIKLGTKKGWTKYMKGFNQISDDLRCGLVPKNERKSMGEETISSNVLDPLALLLLCGIVIVVATLMFFGPAMNRGSWFERAIFVFGYSTGVFAIGFILLRIVDPENRSKTLNDTAFAAPFTTPAEMFAWSMGPMMLLNGSHWKFIGIYLVIMAACIIANIVFKWWWLKLPLDRPGVEEIG